MVGHSEDKPLENKTRDQKKPASSSLIFQDEDEDTPDFDRTINLGTPVVSGPDDQNFDSTIQFDSMEPLFEEESAKPDSGTGKEDTHIAPEPEKPADEAYDLGIHTDELDRLKDFLVEDNEKDDEPTVALADMPDEEDEPSDIHSIIGGSVERLEINENSLNDENSTFTAPAKKIELTEADYADANTVSVDAAGLDNVRKSIEPDVEEPQTTDETPCDVPEAISEPAGAIDSQVISAAATEAPALQDKPGIATEDETPKGLSAKEPVVPSMPVPRTGLATALGLLGIVVASVALWMNFGLSDSMNQMETQLVTMQNNTATLTQHKDITALNQRLNKLNTQFAAHLKTIAHSEDASPVSETKAPPAATPVTTKPAVTAVVPVSHSRQGEWVVNLTSLGNSVAANNELNRLRHLGVHAESVKANIQGKIWYRIRVAGFAGKEAAERQRKVLAKKLGIQDAWSGKR